MANTPNLNLIELIYDNTKKVKDFFMNEIIGKTNSNNKKIDTAIAEKITQVALKSTLPTSPTTSNNLYIVYGDTKNNNGQYRWNGTIYEKISTQLDYATKTEAEAGADNTKVMTPQRVRDFFIANGGGSGGVTNVVFQSGKKYYKFTATAVTDNFEIPSNLFNPTTDVIELIHSGNIPLIKDENYTLVGNLVTFIGYSLDINDDIHCLITNTAYSYNALVDTPDLSNIVRYTDSEIGTPVGVNADTLGGQLPSYYGKQIDVDLKANINHAHTEYTTTKQFDTVLEQKADKEKNVLKRYTVTSQTELDNALNDYAISLPAYTSYEFALFVNFSGGTLSGSLYEIIGFKSGEGYELQTAKVYSSNNSPLLLVRQKYNCTWQPWKLIATTDKVDILITPASGYTISRNNSYKVNNTLYFNFVMEKTNGTDFVSNTNIGNAITDFSFKSSIQGYNIPLAAAGQTSGGMPVPIDIACVSPYDMYFGKSTSAFKRIMVCGTITV